MNTEKKLNSKILKLITTIRERHPELQQYIGKMPALIPHPKCPDTNIRNLMEYYDALDLLVKNYLFKPSDLCGTATTMICTKIQSRTDKKLHRSFSANSQLNSPVENHPDQPAEIFYA